MKEAILINNRQLSQLFIYPIIYITFGRFDILLILLSEQLEFCNYMNTFIYITNTIIFIKVTRKFNYLLI